MIILWPEFKFPPINLWSVWPLLTGEYNINNRLHNASNPYQGNAKKVLCVCSAGLLRSPTAAKVLGEKYGYNTRACGIDVSHALIPMDYVLLEWADEVVCMDEQQHHYITEFMKRFDTTKHIGKVKVLVIDDSYSYMQPELVDNILEKYKP